MRRFGKIFHWLFGHVLFYILKWLVHDYIWIPYGTAGMLILYGIWNLVKANISFGSVTIFCGLALVAISIYYSRKPILQILNPVDGGEVGFEHMVRIYALRSTPFQLLIFSGDKLWHLQKNVPATGGPLYDIKCQFGIKDSPRPTNNLKGEYIIQAIAGSEVKESVVDDLPKRVIKSKSVCVYRKIQAIRIIGPPDKASVPLHTLVLGTISDLNTAVWIIIHPKDSPHYYVYPKINGIKVEKNGTWGRLVEVKWEESPRPAVGRTMMSLADVVKGVDGVDGDVGKHFQIMAVANPEENLGKVDRLTRWPRAEYESEIIEVIRE
jgi:hypothetical protein